MSHCEINLERKGSEISVVIQGNIDEDIDFNQYSLTGASTVTINLNQIKAINSCGIREWIKWMGTAGTASVEYYACPKIIVDQINMVQGFLPQSGRVVSFYVPYYCEETGEERNVLFTYGKEFTEEGVNPPGNIKDDKGNVFEIDVVESKYFKFLGKR